MKKRKTRGERGDPGARGQGCWRPVGSAAVRGATATPNRLRSIGALLPVLPRGLLLCSFSLRGDLGNGVGGRLAACVGTSHSYLTALSTGNTVSPAVSQRAGPLPISLPRSRALPWRRRRHPLESARATSCLPWGRAGWEGRDTVLGVNIPWSFRRFLGSGGARRSAGRPAPLLQAEAPRAGPGRWPRGPRPARRPGVGSLTKARLEERNPRHGFAASGELRGVPSMWFLRPNCLLPASPRSSGSEGPREASGLKNNEDPSAKTT